MRPNKRTLAAMLAVLALATPFVLAFTFLREPIQPNPPETGRFPDDYTTWGRLPEIPRTDPPGSIEQSLDELEAARPLRGPSPSPVPPRPVTALPAPGESLMEIAGIPLPPPRRQAPASRTLFLESPETLVVERIGPPTRVIREVRTDAVHIKTCQWYFFDPIQILDARFEDGYLVEFHYTDIASISEQQRQWMIDNQDTVEEIAFAAKIVAAMLDRGLVTVITPKGSALGVYTRDAWYRVPDDEKEIASRALMLYGLLLHGTTSVSFLDWELGIETAVATPRGGYRVTLADN